jgi:hypothetical protein
MFCSTVFIRQRETLIFCGASAALLQYFLSKRTQQVERDHRAQQNDFVGEQLSGGQPLHMASHCSRHSLRRLRLHTGAKERPLCGSLPAQAVTLRFFHKAFVISGYGKLHSTSRAFIRKNSRSWSGEMENRSVVRVRSPRFRYTALVGAAGDQPRKSSDVSKLTVRSAAAK